MRNVLKRAASLTAVVALSLGTMAALDAPANAASSCTTAFKTYSSVKAGSKGTKAKAVQCLLKKAGYSVKVDGSFSSADASKLKKFQSKHKLSKTGRTSKATWTALVSQGSKVSLKQGSKGANVKRLQTSLTAAGFKVRSTGYFGPLTKSAVKKLQRSQGWSQTGKATAGVWRALQAGAEAKVKTTKAKKAKAPAAVKSSGTGSKAKRALAFAKKQIGDSYRYGASGPSSWDCSGLTQGAYKSVGVKLPHSARQQYSKGKRIKKSDLRPGDLVFFYGGISHVGMYVGDGKIVHASRPGKPVKIDPMKYMPYQGARRVA